MNLNFPIRIKIGAAHLAFVFIFFGFWSCTDLILNASLDQEQFRKDCQECKNSYRLPCLARGSSNPNVPPGAISWRPTVTTTTVNSRPVTTVAPYSSGEVLIICEVEGSLFCNSQKSCKRVWKTGGDSEEESSSSSSSSSSN